ncbi:MAG: carboxypeptidase regulatory-like domain-containing protein [Acidobacteriota bacterium]
MRSRLVSRHLPLIALLVLWIAASPALAQRTSASLRGTITDPSGGILPGVTVTLTGTETGLIRSVLTNAQGNFSFSDVPVGDYELEASLDGFKTATVRAIELNVADTRRIDVPLELGAISEVITTTADSAPIETIGGEVAGLVTGEQIRDLPLNGRNFVQLTQLMPGVSTPDGGFDSKNKGLLGGVNMSVSGGTVTGNLWTVDGANNNDVGANRTILVYPSVDAIEEFKIHRNSYGAEFGGAGGAQINLVTRGGSNEFKGSAYYFHRDDSLNETNFFLEQANLDTEPLERDDYGFTLGGPIVQDKLHFFISGEINEETRGVVRSGFVPTAAERAGDFSGGGIPGCSPGTPIDPLTGNPFPGNVIPQDRLSPAGLLFLQLYPLPNVNPAAGTCNNWVQAVSTPIDWAQANARVDWNISDSTRALIRYTDDSWENGAPNAGEANGLWGDDPFPAVDSTWDQPGSSLVTQLTQTLGAEAVNTLTFSLSGNSIDITRGGDNAELNNQINAAIPAIFDNKTSGGDRAHPVFWGGQGYATLWNIAPWNNEQDLLTLKDDYERAFGDHWVKAGVLYSENSKFETCCGSSSHETPQFWGSTGLAGGGGNTGNILSDFLLEDMLFGFSENSFQPAPEVNWEDIEVYVSDSWQLNDRMTLDFGVRYSRYKEPYTSDNNITNFDPNSFDPALGGDPCNGILQVPGTDPCGAAGFLGGTEGPSRSLIEPDEDNFAPRLGFAWDVHGTGKSVVRAGFGQFFQRERVNIQLDFGTNAPFAEVRTGTRTLDSNAEPTPGSFGTSTGVPVRGYQVDAETPYNFQFNLTWEQQLTSNSTLEIGYVGNRGRHITRRSDINYVPIGDRNGNGISDRLEFVRLNGNGGAQGALRNFPVFGNTQILFWESNGSSEYDSLQTQYVNRFGRGSQFQVSYTWSSLKADDPLDDAGAGTFDGQITDRDNPGLDWGYAETHREHVANASLVWNLPTLDGASSFVRNVFGDWTIGAVAIYASGTPLTVYTGSVSGLDGIAGTGFTDNQRPNRVSGVSCSGSGQQILNPAAYTLNGYQLGTNGNAERGDCEGPDFFQVDLSFYKNIRVSDRFTAQFRFEVFNIFNRDNFIGDSVNTDLNPISVTLDAPTGQATQIVDSVIPTSFGQATAARDPRQVQLGFKLLW